MGVIGAMVGGRGGGLGARELWAGLAAPRRAAAVAAAPSLDSICHPDPTINPYPPQAGYELNNKELRSHGELGRGARRQVRGWGDLAGLSAHPAQLAPSCPMPHLAPTLDPYPLPPPNPPPGRQPLGRWRARRLRAAAGRAALHQRRLGRRPRAARRRARRWARAAAGGAAAVGPGASAANLTTLRTCRAGGATARPAHLPDPLPPLPPPTPHRPRPTRCRRSQRPPPPPPRGGGGGATPRAPM
jgi:hypothetical protein